MILSTEIFPIGKIVKTHGAKDELLFQCEFNILENNEIEFIILEIEGIYVPFFIKSIRFFSSDSGALILENVKTEKKRKELIGCSMFLSKEYLHLISNEKPTTQLLIGFELYNANNEFIGVIESINDTTNNPLFVVGTKNDELLIPIADEFFMEIDEEKKKIIVNLPEGLLDIN